MAISKTWGYGSSTASTEKLTAAVMNVNSDFALLKDEPTECVVGNTGSALDLGENVSYSCVKIPTVASGLDNQYPPAVKSGVQYVIKVEEQVKLTDSGNAAYAEILPVTAYVTIRHPKNGNLTSSDIDTVFARLIGACYKTEGGVTSTRFNDLMRSALRPTSDGAPAAS